MASPRSTSGGRSTNYKPTRYGKPVKAAAKKKKSGKLFKTPGAVEVVRQVDKFFGRRSAAKRAAARTKGSPAVKKAAANRAFQDNYKTEKRTRRKVRREIGKTAWLGAKTYRAKR